MTVIHSIAIGKGFVNQEDVVSSGLSTGSYDTPSLKMSKYHSFDNLNTRFSSASTVPGDVPEKDVKEFDRVLFEDRSGMTPGGGFHIPEGRGTIEPDISNSSGLSTDTLPSASEQLGGQDDLTVYSVNANTTGKVIGIAISVLADMASHLTNPPDLNEDKDSEFDPDSTFSAQCQNNYEQEFDECVDSCLETCSDEICEDQDCWETCDEICEDICQDDCTPSNCGCDSVGEGDMKETEDNDDNGSSDVADSDDSDQAGGDWGGW
jgi:hypothetical protein